MIEARPAANRIKLGNQLVEVIDALQLRDTESEMPTLPPTKRRRRGVASDDYGTLATLSLADVDGVLRWVYEPPPYVVGRRRARRRGLDTIEGERIASIPIKDLEPNRILDHLARLDAKLTPHQGLRRWRDGKLAPATAPRIKGKRILLFVHGTFSKGEMFFDEIAATPGGRKYLDAAEKTYDAILVFDHPTLSVSPWINALDLDAELANVSGALDVVCHSRGGLVVAWWLRMTARNVQSVVFVGSPLAGTNLASPPALRAGLDYLGNVMQALSAAGAATSIFVPFAGIVTGIAKTFAKLLSLGSALPLVDAGVAIVPGLAAQSRVSNNAEIRRLFASPWPSKGDLYVITGSFLPDESREPIWKFWRRFTNVSGQLAHGAADLIFPGANDLVVDTDCMRGPPRERDSPGPAAIMNELAFKQRVDFRDHPTVNHCNYFRQEKTVALLDKLR